MRNDSFQGKTVVISGSGNVAIYACGRRQPSWVSRLPCPTNGYVYDPNGIDLPTSRT